jgi:hypothetical protein
MKLCFFLLICLIPPASAEVLLDYQWKRRVLVITQSNDKLAAELTAARAELSERDLEVFVLSGPVGIGKLPDPKFAEELRERLQVKRDLAEVTLLGKDGGTVLRWSAGEFIVNDLLGRIDSMPIRRREMESN